MSLYRPHAGITQIMATWLIMLPYAIGPVSHKTSCVLFINISSTTWVYELLSFSYYYAFFVVFNEMCTSILSCPVATGELMSANPLLLYE
jgi:hypothetical protein